jgi:hypothetical protein
MLLCFGKIRSPSSGHDLISPPEKIRPHSFRESRRRRDVGATIRSLPLVPVSYPASPCLTFWRVGVVGIFQVAPAMPTNDSLRLDELRTEGHFLALPIYFPFALSAISTRRRRMRCRAAAAVGLGYVENRYALPSGAAIIRRRASICASSFCTSIPKVVPPK